MNKENSIVNCSSYTSGGTVHFRMFFYTLMGKVHFSISYYTLRETVHFGMFSYNLWKKFTKNKQFNCK